MKKSLIIATALALTLCAGCKEISDNNAKEKLGKYDALLVPGGFGNRGIEGKIATIKYARENKIPFLGICLGMQMAVVEFARDVLGLKDANSEEFDENTQNPVIHIMDDQKNIENKGGTMRLGSYPCILKEGTKAFELYGKKEIAERHRHRFANPACLKLSATERYESSNATYFPTIATFTGPASICLIWSIIACHSSFLGSTLSKFKHLHTSLVSPSSSSISGTAYKLSTVLF